MAKPYREGKTWSFRLRIQKQDLYRCGFASEVEARIAMEDARRALEAAQRPTHGGPFHTTLGEALQHYGLERLPMLKGARQEANRINRYLRTVGLATLRVVPPEKDGAGEGKARGVVYWGVVLDPVAHERHIPQGLGAHRAQLSARARESDQHRCGLARTLMSDVTAHDIQLLLNQMGEEGYQAATIGLEHALLRRLYSYAKKSWRWPLANAASGLVLPRIDNARDRVLTNREWEQLCAALTRCANPYVAPALGVLLQTAMRCSDALVHARWGDYDRDRCVLTLSDGKTGGRCVPLGPGAVAILEGLWAREKDVATRQTRIFPLSYEALKAAWNRACERAGVQGVRLHDLRHTSATRFALELNGNIPVLKLITGHKTTAQLMRYVNIKADDVVRLLHGRSLDEEGAPAGYGQAAEKQPENELPEILPGNVTVLRRRA